MLGFDTTFKALADATRRAILAELRGGPMSAGQIAEKLRVSPSALSFHLKMLKSADLVRDRRDGQFIWYSLNTSVVEDIMRFFLQHFAVNQNGAAEPPAAGAGDDATPGGNAEDRS